LLVADGLGGPPVAGLEEGEIPTGLAVPDADVRAEGVGQLPAGPRPVLAEQVAEAGRHLIPAGVVRVGAGGIRGERLRPPVGEPVEGGPDGVRVAAEVGGDPGRGPPGGGQQDHLQPVSGHGRKVDSAEGVEFGPLGIR
jgi:hypothetical protein